jgi:hypothetical protein
LPVSWLIPYRSLIDLLVSVLSLRFKILVEALEALPEGIRNNKVNMSGVDEPTCGTAGCFAGLISIVANIIFLRLLFHLLTLTPFQLFVGFIISFLLCLGIGIRCFYSQT